MSELRLASGLAFEDLYNRAGIVRIDALFVSHLQAVDLELHNRFVAARAAPDDIEDKAESELLLDLAPHIDDFLGELFGIAAQLRALAAGHDKLAPLYSCKRLFVQRQAAKKIKPEQAETLDGPALESALAERFGEAVTEEAFARHIGAWEEGRESRADDLDLALNYAAWATHSAAGQAQWRDGVLFKVPHKTDPLDLVPVDSVVRDGVTVMKLPEASLREREGFALTDRGMDLNHALDQANYCIWCHNQGKDSCSKGLRDRKSGEIKDNDFGMKLTGCPLDEKISEMNLAKIRGQAIGALAIVAVDNPLCAATGHRICNDCMKACIYQKQEPVDIPQIETRTLKDVLDLPWGFEIYSLLTRWVPLDLKRPLPKADSGYKVLVVGLGPAGFNLSHHLLNDGHTVVAIDGLKIEPLPADISGVAPGGARVPFRPIEDIASLREPLDERLLAGFGGVAEYGITVRWDKNFLKIIRLLLERRTAFAMYGGTRFGGTMTIDDAREIGFDHIALCSGAGKPTFIPMPNSLAKGVRMASDFLMSLQLTGAAKRGSIANLQVRLPIVVVGGGLTAVDSATEALAYYPVQVEKFLARYQALVAERGEAAVRASWTGEERETAEEFLAHGEALRAERQAAAAEGRVAGIRALLDGWGGSTLAYRRRLIDAPSYTGNHEEVAKALEEGIYFAECVSPKAIEVDPFGHAKAIRLAQTRVGEDGRLSETGEETLLPARTVLIAAGTQPNTVLAREDPENVPPLDGKYFQAFSYDGTPVKPERIAKPERADVFMAQFEDGRAMSFWGDLHPSFAGNVVKAMGGTKQGYPLITQKMAEQRPLAVEGAELIDRLNSHLRPRVKEVIRLAPEIIEIVIEAPMQARQFQPGQFYRLQNFEALALHSGDTTLAVEGLALTGAWVDREKGLISTVVLEMGGSSSVCAHLKEGEPVVLMGPTGAPTEIPSGETVVLAGGGLGNAVLFSIGQALRAAGSRVLYFAGYKKLAHRYHVENIEAAADEIIWCCDEAPGFTATRPEDKSYCGNIVEAMLAYAKGELGEGGIPLTEADRLIVIGSDRMMAAVAAARHDVLQPYFKPGHVAIGSINSPMQCMMKEICAQCLQMHRDPKTGEERVIFSCFNQDQDLDHVDFASLNTRLNQNAAQEKVTRQWISRCLMNPVNGEAAE